MPKKMKNRIGIMGGTFDPFHNGHLTIVKEIRDYLNLSSIFLMPNYIPPHKNLAKTSDQARLEMIKLVCEEEGFFSLDTEIKKKGTSYLFDTLCILENQEPFNNSDLYFIIGMDSLLSFHKWYKPQGILEKTNIAVAYRPNYQYQGTENWIDEKIVNKSSLKENAKGQIILCPTSKIDISSSQIRQKDLSFLKTCVPNSIFNYVKNHHLYYDYG